MTILASDGTSGNSYAGKQIRIHIGKPALLAQISADKLVGKAPLTVNFSAKKSIAPRRKTRFSWDVYQPTSKRKATPPAKLRKGKSLRHKFDKPGLYEVTLTVKNGKESDSETVQILVTKAALLARPAGLSVEGNGVLIANKSRSPSLFDHSDFGSLGKQRSLTRRFFLINSGDKELRLDTKKRIVLEGEHARSFKIIGMPQTRLGSRSRSPFLIRFKPKDSAAQEAWVSIHAGAKTFRFLIRGSK